MWKLGIICVDFSGLGVNGKIYVVRFSKFQRECFAPRILLFKCFIASLRLSGVSSQRFVAFAFAQFLKSRDRRNSECREATPRNADRPPENERQRFRISREVTTTLRKLREKPERRRPAHEHREAKTDRRPRRRDRDVRDLISMKAVSTANKQNAWSLFHSIILFQILNVLSFPPKIGSRHFYEFENVIFGTDWQMFFQHENEHFEALMILCFLTHVEFWQPLRKLV